MHKWIVKDLEDGVEGPGIYVGLSGVGWMLLNVFQDKEGAKICADRSLNLWAESNKSKKRVTMLEGVSGSLVLAASVAAANGDRSTVERYARDTLALYGNVKALGAGECEVLYGRSGYLQAVLVFRRLLHDNQWAENIVDELCQHIQCEGVKMESPLPMSWSWHDKVYLGFAHGIAGILATLLQCGVRTDMLKETITDLIKLQFPDSGNLPSSLHNDKDRLVQWCHGAPGLMQLLFFAALAFPEEKGVFEVAMEACARAIWHKGLLTKGMGLCHGIAGNGYAFLCLFQLTKNELYLRMAIVFANEIMSNWRRDKLNPDRPRSLFEGMAGVVFFLNDLEQAVTDPLHYKFHFAGLW